MPTTTKSRLDRLARETGSIGGVYFQVLPAVGPYSQVTLAIGSRLFHSSCADLTKVHEHFTILLDEAEAEFGIYEPATIPSGDMLGVLPCSLEDFGRLLNPRTSGVL